MVAEPAWLTEARKWLGAREVPGVTSNPLIVGWWKAIKRGGIKSDEVPWCAAFVGAQLEAVGIVSTRFEAAKSYLTWGRGLSRPVVGCIVVFERDGGGHVGFVVGADLNGNLMVLGGNQADEVNIRAFPVARVAGYRWPAAVPVPVRERLPILSAVATSGEA